ncbi:hypothetical protein [Candidatus Odyssella acanthamoebae]|uniref:Uncharacterized protein n=1 Tax=Candidatus Odyssella acanthamoebae TaxID=91604 RepID=A0A077ATB1_9PROT|nr:hypothetical protein [Candidatus Paracaedibacter acanthamoebae]AIK95626.1 hypothetical protein ID47_00985 [Candidatus Paracaedibacter acanthamoebae]
MNNFTSMLFVPVNLQGMVVNQQVINGSGFNRWSMDYNALIKEFQSPEPPPFGNLSGNIKQGIHLHWTLPNTLTHGTTNQFLFTVNLGINDIVIALEQGQVSSDFQQQFNKNGAPLATTGITVTPIKTAQQWLISDWAHKKNILFKNKIMP